LLALQILDILRESFGMGDGIIRSACDLALLDRANSRDAALGALAVYGGCFFSLDLAEAAIGSMTRWKPALIVKRDADYVTIRADGDEIEYPARRMTGSPKVEPAKL
jgi:hypothetical protein